MIREKNIVSVILILIGNSWVEQHLKAYTLSAYFNVILILYIFDTNPKHYNLVNVLILH